MATPFVPSLSSLRRTALRVLLGFAVAGGGVVLTKPAAAHPSLPGVIQEHLEAPCAPSCGICHVSPSGGGVTKAPPAVLPVGPAVGAGVFVENLKVIALLSGVDLRVAPSEDQFKKVLDALNTKECVLGSPPCNSDGDAETDYQEISLGHDPDKAGTGVMACPEYGCGARVAPAPVPASRTDATALIAALGVALVLVRRLRRSA